MLRGDLKRLYDDARSRHIGRREQALRVAVIRQGNGAALPRPYVRQQLRAWFDIWEQHLWDTYNEAKCAPEIP